MTKIKEKQNIPEGWELKTLGSLVLIKKGEQLNRLAMDDTGKYPALNGGINLSGYTDKWNTETDTITISEGGNSCGYVNLNRERFWCGGHCYALLKPVENVNNSFLYQALKSKQGQLMKLRVGSGLPNIQKRSIEEFLLLFPKSKKEQQKIAEILGVVDEDIAKTQGVIDATEKLKRGLMQKLFTRGISHTKFKETKLGEMPEEWEVVLLDNVSKRGSGHTPNKKVPEYYNGGIKWVSLADSNKLDNGEISETKIQISEEGVKNSSAVLHSKGTVILSRDAGIGKSAVLSFGMAVSQHFMAWTCGENLHNWFLYYYLQLQKKEIERIAMGSTIKTIGLPYFKKMEIPLPNIKEQQKITEILSAVDEKISVNKKLLAKLT